jgi:DNA-binding MarR family transcriptional regulator
MKQKQHFHDKTLSALGSPSYLARRLLNAFAQHYEALFRSSDITYPQWTILMLLYTGFGRTAAEMARQMCHDAGAMTRLVDQLEKRGFVARLRDTADRRIVNLVLTDQGHALADTLKSRVVAFLNVALEDFSQEEFATWLRLTSRMITVIDAQPIGEPRSKATAKAKPKPRKKAAR